MITKSPAIYIRKENIWYGSKNEAISKELSSLGINDTLTFDKASSKPRALVVFGSDQDLVPQFHSHWLSGLNESHDMMVIRVETYGELNVWFQNIMAKVQSISKIVFNVHANTHSFTFNTRKLSSRVKFDEGELVPHFASLLNKGGDVVFCACLAGRETFVLKPSYGITKQACVARKLTFLIKGISVFAPTRSICASNIRFQDGQFSFVDGRDDITSVYHGTKVASLDPKKLLASPVLLRKVLEEKRDLNPNEMKKLFLDAANQLHFEGAIELLKTMTPEERLKAMDSSLGEVLKSSFWGWETQGESDEENPWHQFLEKIYQLDPHPFDAQPNPKPCTDEYIKMLLARGVERGMESLGLAAINTAITKQIALEEDFLKEQFDQAIAGGQQALAKSIIEYASKVLPKKRLLSHCLKALPSSISYQPREISDLFREFELIKVYKHAEALFDKCRVDRAVLKPTRVDAWQAAASPSGKSAIVRYRESL